MAFGFRAAICAGLGLVVSVSALAGVEITAESNNDGKVMTNTMYIGADRMKMDMGNHAMIFRADQQKTVILDKDKHTYMDMSALKSQMAGVQAQMQAQLKNMPEAQRKQIEAAMAQHGGGMMGQSQPDEPMTYEKAGTKTVGNWSCTVYHEKQGAELVADACIAPMSAVGLTPADMAVFKSFSDNMSHSMPFGGERMKQMDLDAQTRAIGFAGMPVETTTYMDGKPVGTTTFKSFTHTDLPADLFEIPAGYTQRDMHGMGGAPE